MTDSEREPFTMGLEPFTSPEGVIPEDAPKDATKRVRSRPNLHCSIPRSLRYRLDSIIVAERRTTATVIDKLVSDYLSLPENEPRPFLPIDVVQEDTDSRNYSIAPELYSSLRERASYEGRTVQVLFLRAVYDYVNASPDDPVKQEVEG